MNTRVELSEDKRKVEKLYEAYNGLMFSVAKKVLNKKEDVEDAVFHAWERIIKNIHKISEIDCKETKSFIVIITERISIDFYRKNKKGNICSIDEYEESPYLLTKDKDFETYEIISWIRTVPKRYSETLILYYVNGFSIKEIANMLGIKENSVSCRLVRGREMLRKQILYKEKRLNIKKFCRKL